MASVRAPVCIALALVGDEFCRACVAVRHQHPGYRRQL